MATQYFMTPVGEAVYPWLNRPDTEFGNVYKTGIKLPADQASELIANITKINQEAHGTKADKAYVPYKTDDASGDYIFTMKSKYQPKLVDSTGQVMPPESAPMIWGGSQLRVKGAIKPYNNNGKIGSTLQISAVQVVKLGESTAETFDAVDGGFVAEANNAQPKEEQAASQADDFNF